MNTKRSSLFYSVVVLLLVLSLLATSAFAWFHQADNAVQPTLEKGILIQQCFHCGTGTKADPFVITRPIHYYHLVELYQRQSLFAGGNYYFQLGYDLDENPANGLEVYNYNELAAVVTNTDGGDYNGTNLSKTLNLAYYTDRFSLIPIGTSQNPFRGHFDGKGLTIANLSVVASETIGDTRYASCDVGIFGSVEASDDDYTVKDLYFDNVTISLTGTSAGTICNLASGANAHDTDSDGISDTVYIGYLIGHLYSYQNAGQRDYMEQTVGTNASPINNVYVNRVTITGGASDTAKCDFGYIGRIDLLDGNTAMTITQVISSMDQSGSGDEGWGGSIDMTSLYTRIKAALGSNTTNGINRDTSYPSSETIVAPETPGGSGSVTVGGTTGIGNSDYGTVYYWSAKNAAGTYVGTVNGNYTYLYGLKDTQTTQVTTYTKTGEEVPAWLIHDNGKFLSVDGTSIAAADVTKDAAKWLYDANGHWYTWVGNVQYFLNAVGNTGVTIQNTTATNATVWTKSNSSAERHDSGFYTDISGTRYYLIYNGGWTISSVEEYYYIGDGNGHFLTADTSAVSNVSAGNSAVLWQISDPTGSSTQIYFIYNGNNYYLGTNGTSLTISTSPTTWGKDSNGYYATVAGEKFYLMYSGGWTAQLISGYRISDGNGHFLSANGTLGVTNTAEGAATIWLLSNPSGNTTFATVIGGTKYYLGFNNGLTLSTTPVTWTKDQNGYYVMNGSLAVYLCYDTGWGVISNFYYTISDGNGNYLTNNGTSGVTNTTSATTGRWYFSSTSGNPSGDIWTMIDGINYYLCFENGGLTLKTSAGSAWSNNGSSLYVTENGIHYYLTYDNGWTLFDATRYRIWDGNGNYLVLNGANNYGNTTTAGNATLWYQDRGAEGQFYTYIGNTKYYISVTDGLKTSTTATTLTSANGALYYQEDMLCYCLAYVDGAWTVKTVNNGYLVSDGNGNYLQVTGTGTSSYTNTTNQAEATRFNFSSTGGTPSGTISTQIGGVTYYLRNNNGTLQISTTSTSWSNNGNNLYNSSRYLVCADGIWGLVTDASAKTLYRIKTSDGYYMKANDTTLTTTTNAAEAILWNSTSGNISTEINGTTYYLYGGLSNNSSVTLNSSSNRNWSYSGGKLHYSILSTFYLKTSGTSWTVDKKSSNGSTIEIESVSIPAKHSNVSQINESFPTVGVLQTEVAAPNVTITREVQTVPPISLPTYSITPSLTTEKHMADLVLDFRPTTETLYEATVTTVRRSGYIPLRLESESNLTSISPKNTGYIIGGSYSAKSGSGQGDIRVSGYNISGNISNSYSSSTNTLSTIYTYNGSGSPVAITDANKGTQFDSTKEKLLEMLSKNNTTVYGLHFMNSAISKSRVISAEEVTVLGKTYVNYELPESCIDFNVASKGYITFFAGDYYSSTDYGTNDTFFSLHQIYRNADTTISAIKEIEAVYRTTANEARDKYIYKYTDGTYTNSDGSYTGATSLASGYLAEPVFKTEWITNPESSTFNHGYIYYFEIPCNDGEYALGSVKGKTGGYLLYLDIASNGNQGANYNQDSGISNNPLFTQIDFRNEGTVINSPLNIGYTIPEGNSTSNFSVGMVYDGEYIYTITVTNTTGEEMDLSVLLVDNDDNSDNSYPFMYKIIYNGVLQTSSSTSFNAEYQAYTSSATYSLPAAQ